MICYSSAWLKDVVNQCLQFGFKVLHKPQGFKRRESRGVDSNRHRSLTTPQLLTAGNGRTAVYCFSCAVFTAGPKRLRRTSSCQSVPLGQRDKAGPANVSLLLAVQSLPLGQTTQPDHQLCSLYRWAKRLNRTTSCAVFTAGPNDSTGPPAVQSLPLGQSESGGPPAVS